MTHLYNAVLQQRLLSKRWTDMETMISIQTAEAFFVGAPPQAPENYLKNLRLSIGESAADFARHRRQKVKLRKARVAKGVEQIALVSLKCADRYCNNAQSVSWTRESIKPILDTKFEYGEIKDTAKEGAPVCFLREPKKGAKKEVPGIMVRCEEPIDLGNDAEQFSGYVPQCSKRRSFGIEI